MRKGFTLIELLIVVAIIAILAAIAVPNFLEAQVRAKIATVKSDQRSLATAIESYAVDNNMPPPLYPRFLESSPGDLGLGEGEIYYRMFNHYMMDLVGTGEPGVLCKALTTPIAYIADIPMDQFRFFRNHPTWDRRRTSFWYCNVEGAYDAKNAGLETQDGINFAEELVSPTEVVFNGIGGTSYYVSWMMSSHGPLGDHVQYDNSGQRVYDLHWIGSDYPKLDDGWISTYDATNGTVSRGLIIRTSAGIPLQ